MRKWQQNRMQVHIQMNHILFFFLFVLCEEVLGVHDFDLKPTYFRRNSNKRKIVGL